jgi:hypothetical protein
LHGGSRLHLRGRRGGSLALFHDSHVMTHDATADRADKPVVVGKMAGDSAGERAGDTSNGKRWLRNDEGRSSNAEGDERGESGFTKNHRFLIIGNTAVIRPAPFS